MSCPSIEQCRARHRLPRLRPPQSAPPLSPTGKGKDGKGAQYGKEQKASKGKTPELGKPETLLSKGPKGDLAGNTQFSPADKGKTDDPKKGKGGKDLKGGKAKEKKGP